MASGSAGFVFQLHSSLSTILERKSAHTSERRYTQIAYCELGVLGLMWMSFRAAGYVYQLTSTVPGANSTGLCLATINLLWSHLEPHPPTGSAALLLSRSHSTSLLCSRFSLFSPNPFWLLLKLPAASLSSFPLRSCPLPPSDLIPALNLSPVRQRAGIAEVVNLRGARSIKQGQAEWSTKKKMRFVTRMGTVGHKSCHPGCLRGHAYWLSSSSSSPPRRAQQTHCKQLGQQCPQQPAKQINPY